MQRAASDSSQDTYLDPIDTKALEDSSWGDTARIWIQASTQSTRTLILCFDGTGDQFDGDNSNVVQFVSMLRKDDTKKQLVYYQTGIGTYANPVVKVPMLTKLYKTVDEMFATNLSSHIKDGYAFLMQNYTAGDKIHIFGFSRGAYTARALAGMLQKVGLLPVYNYQQIPFAYRMYKREDEEGIGLSNKFKRTFCRDVPVDFLGVWDTVASVGLVPQYLPFTSQNNGIKCLRHALALDERRIKFMPTYHSESRTDEKPRETEAAHAEKVAATTRQDKLNSQHPGKTDAKEVWFAGVHTDVGGGSVRNEEKNALARIPLRWMIRECFRCHTGIIFDAVSLQSRAGLNIIRGPDGKLALGEVPARIPGAPPPLADSTLKPSFSGRVSSTFNKSSRTFAKERGTDPEPEYWRDLGEHYEAEEEQRDATSPLNDQLKAHWWWTFLEYMPTRVKKQRAIVNETNGSDDFKWVWNRGRGRKIYKSELEEGMIVHRSVKTRLEAHAKDEKYIPQVRPHLSESQDEPARLSYDQWTKSPPEHWTWEDD